MQNLAPIAFLDEDGDIRVNFGMFAGREATKAEIDDLARALLEEVDAITIVAEQRTIADQRDGGVRAPDPDRAERGRPRGGRS